MKTADRIELPSAAQEEQRACRPTSWWRNAASIYASSVGRKYVMALSGIAIVGFVVAHLIGTLKIFLGEAATNAYGEGLRELGAPLAPRTHLLWGFRIGLLLAFAIHLHAAFSLDRRNRQANGPVRGRQLGDASTYASRTMLWSGIIVGLFIVFHLADLTWGATHADFVHGDPYGNQIASFRRPGITAIYLLAIAALTTHLRHGFWSLTQSLGFRTTRFDEVARRRLAASLAATIGLGYASVPVAVLTGLVGSTPGG